MRWLSFAVIVFFICIVQVAFAPVLGVGEKKLLPDLFLLLAVLLAFRGAGDEILVAGWILGLVKDLSSKAPLGSYALAFGMVTLVIVHFRDFFYGERWLTVMVLTFVSALITEHVFYVICYFKGILVGSSYWATLKSIILMVLLTAGSAPIGQWLMIRYYRQLGIPKRRIYNH